MSNANDVFHIVPTWGYIRIISNRFQQITTHQAMLSIQFQAFCSFFYLRDYIAVPSQPDINPVEMRFMLAYFLSYKGKTPKYWVYKESNERKNSGICINCIYIYTGSVVAS